MGGFYIGVDGKARKVKGGYIGIDGKARKLKKGYIGDENGIARLCWSAEKKLGDFPVGATVYLNENGSPVEFYVAQHNYEPDLNGAGRTLLVRKDCYDMRKWHRTAVNAYATSDIDAWLNSDYIGLLDDNIKDAIGTTKFRYTVGDGFRTLTTLNRSVFLLSIAELGCALSNANKEGSALPIADILSIAHYDGAAVSQWTRTPLTDSAYNTCYVLHNGSAVYASGSGNNFGSRPCFTLPDSVPFDL